MRFLPLGIGLFDVTENLLILTLLGEYPHAPALLGTLAGFATLSKYSLTALTLVLLGVFSLRVAAHRRSS